MFTDALDREGLLPLIEARHDGLVDLSRDDPSRPILLAMSDNGPQMTRAPPASSWPCARSTSTSAGPAPRPTRPGPGSLFGHVKAEWPHLLRITDPAVLRAELAVVREHYNGVRLHAGIGYVTPNDEHEGRGPAIRKAREAGLEQARLRRIAYHRANRTPDPSTHPEHDPPEEPGDVG